MDSEQPISEEEFENIITSYIPFLGAGSVAVSVSGGGDSLALSLLMNRWCKKFNFQLYALTVNHNLRTNSTSEALKVSSWLKSYAIQHHILTWNHFPIKSRVQEQARDARYRLLFEWCKKNNVTSLLTAHHILDQWETFMIRLSKGSGLKGLGCIKSVGKRSFGYLLRPLLSISPNRLKATLKIFNQPFISDPSNEDEKFKRVQWRKTYSSLCNIGLDASSVEKSIQNIQQFNHWFDNEIEKIKKECWINSNINLIFYKKLDPLFRHRILNDALIQVGGSKYPMSQASIQRVDNMIMLDSSKKITLGNCILQSTGNILIVTQEIRK